MEIVTVNPQKCIGCNACVRVCPVSEACVVKTAPDGRIYTDIDSEKCINCGECIRCCPHGARDYIDDYEDFIEDMYSKKGQVSLLVDPSIKVAFPDVWQDVLKWFYTQGIRKIYDVSFGADIATWAQLHSVNKNLVGKYITSSCAAVVSYAQKHNPGIIPKLSPVHSPAACTAIYARRQLHDTADFAYLGPCIARKEEFEDTTLIKYNVTFKRMKEYFDKRKISFSSTGQGYYFEFSGKQGLMGSIYPKPEGLKENILLYRNDLNITSSAGFERIYSQMNDYLSLSDENAPDVFELLSCNEGCNASVGMSDNISLSTISRVMDITKRDAEKRRSGIFLNKTDKLFKEFDRELSIELYCRKYNAKSKFVQQPTNNDLNNIFNSMFKNNTEDRNINCTACGCKTCTEMATAIFHGANVKENCVYYSKNLPKNDSAQVAEIRRNLNDMAKIIKDNIPHLSDNVTAIRKEAVSIFSNNNKTADAAKTINSVIEQMIEACNNPKGVSQETLAEICSTLDLIRKILLNLGKFVTKNSESGYNIDKSITQVDNIAVNISETVDAIINKTK